MSVFENINTSNPNNQGDLGEAAAIYHLSKLGYRVYLPISGTGKTDLIIEDSSGKLFKVQVKTSTCVVRKKHDGTILKYTVNLCTTGGNRLINTRRPRVPGDYDYLFVLIDTGECWFIPDSALGTVKHSIHVGTEKFQDYKIV